MECIQRPFLFLFYKKKTGKQTTIFILFIGLDYQVFDRLLFVGLFVFIITTRDSDNLSPEI